jgi:hypothetical protein
VLVEAQGQQESHSEDSDTTISSPMRKQETSSRISSEEKIHLAASLVMTLTKIASSEEVSVWEVVKARVKVLKRANNSKMILLEDSEVASAADSVEASAVDSAEVSAVALVALVLLRTIMMTSSAMTSEVALVVASVLSRAASHQEAQAQHQSRLRLSYKMEKK